MLLSDLHARTTMDPSKEYELTELQWNALVRAFTEPLYEPLRDIQGISDVPFNGPDDSGELKVGSREVERLYSWLFDPRDEHKAHVYLHALKKAARQGGEQGVLIVLELLFNDLDFTGIEWPVSSRTGLGGVVSLDIDPGFLGLVVAFLRDQELSYLEPYEGGAVCKWMENGAKRIDACY